MENKVNKNAAEEFALAFGAAFSDSVLDGSGAALTLKVTESPDTPTSEDDPLQFRLTLGGGHSGRCFVEIDKQDAAELCSMIVKEPAAGYRDEHAEVLVKMLTTASGMLSAQLAKRYDGISFDADRIQDVAFGGMLAVSLGAVTESGSPIAMTLYFDKAFLSTLTAKLQSTAMPIENEKLAVAPANLKLVMDVELAMSLRFGQRRMALRDVLELNSGSVIELDCQVDEPVELLLDGKVIARGEAVIVDGNYGLRVTEVPEPVASYLGR